MRWRNFVAISTFGLAVSNANADDSREVWIAVHKADSTIQLQVFANLSAGETARFQLTSRKFGQSGSAVSQQSGTISSRAGQSAQPISSSQFSLRGDDVLEAELTVTTSTGRTLTDKISASAE